jgi:hypothetical protein
MADLGKAELPIEPGLSGFGALLQRELLKVNTKGPGLTAIENNLGKPIDGLRSKIGAVGALLGGALLVGGFKKAIDETVAWGGEIKKLVRSTGLATEAASGLALEAEHFGLDVDTLSRGLGLFEKHIVANDKQFRSLGISVRDAHGNLLPFDQILAKTSAIFQNLADGPQKTALALNLFGRNGKALLPFLSAGPAAMKQFSEEAKKLGLSLSGTDLISIQKYQFATRDFTASLHGLEVQVGLRLLPVLTGFFHVVEGGVTLLSKIPAPVLGSVAAFGGFVLTVNLATRAASAARAALGSVGAGFSAIKGEAAGSAAALQAHAVASGEAAASDVALGEAGLGLQVAALKEATAVNLAAAAAERMALANATAGEQALAASIALQKEAGAAAEVGTAAAAGGGGFLAMAAGAAKAFAPIGIVIGGLTLMNHFQNQGKKDAEAWAQALAAAAGTGQTAIDKLTTSEKDLESQFQALVAKHGGFRGLVFSGADAKAGDALVQKIKAIQEQLKQLGIEATAVGDPVTKIEGTLNATATFQDNLKRLVSEGVPLQVADELKKMGQDGQDAAQQLADATGAAGDQLRQTFIKDVQDTLPAVEQKLAKFFGLTRTEFKAWTSGLIAGFDFIDQNISTLASSLSDSSISKAVASATGKVTSATNAEAAAKQHLADFEARLHLKKTITAADLLREKELQDKLTAAQVKAGDATSALTAAQNKDATAVQAIIKAFQEQLKAQDEYTQNFEKLLGKHLPNDLVKQLAEMGSSGAGFVQALASANNTQFNTIVTKWEDSKRHARTLSREIFNYFNNPITIPVGIKAPSPHVAKSIARTLQNELNDTSLSSSVTPKFTTASMIVQAANVTISAGTHAAEGMILRRPTFLLGGEAGDEAVIPLGADKKARRRQLLEESGIIRELLGSAIHLGDGGIVRPSFAPSALRASPRSGNRITHNNYVTVNYPRPVDDPGQSVTHALKTLELLLT